MRNEPRTGRYARVAVVLLRAIGGKTLLVRRNQDAVGLRCSEKMSFASAIIPYVENS
jgi:hypothetical protein